MNILPVDTPEQLDDFIRLPFALYADDTNWVPPLVSAEKKMMDRDRNPFFKHAEARHFLAQRDGQLVGRISAIVNRTHNEIHGEQTGFWGYFESENDPETAGALFDHAGKWLKEKGMNRENPSCSYV